MAAEINMIFKRITCVEYLIYCEDFFLKFDEGLHGYSFGYVINPFGLKLNSSVTKTVHFDDAEKYMKIILGVPGNETLSQVCENQHQNFEEKDPQIEQQQQQQPLTPPPLLPLPQPPAQNEEKQLTQPQSPPSIPPPQQIKAQKFNNCSLDYSIKGNYMSHAKINMAAEINMIILAWDLCLLELPY
ncbi:hypothetical protein ACTFIW_000391 [Dictyostelium discoideum]